MRQRNAVTQPRTYADDVMTEERTMPTIRLAPMPMPQRAPKRRPTQKLLKRVARITPKPEEDDEPKSWLYHRLDHAFAQVRMIMDGKAPRKTLDELIEELRMEKQKLEQDELRNSVH